MCHPLFYSIQIRRNKARTELSAVYSAVLVAIKRKRDIHRQDNTQDLRGNVNYLCTSSISHVGGHRVLADEVLQDAVVFVVLEAPQVLASDRTGRLRFGSGGLGSRRWCRAVCWLEQCQERSCALHVKINADGASYTLRRRLWFR